MLATFCTWSATARIMSINIWVNMRIVVALEEGHSRVAECTRLIPEGEYSGKRKRFVSSTHETRTHEHLKI